MQYEGKSLFVKIILTCNQFSLSAGATGYKHKVDVTNMMSTWVRKVCACSDSSDELMTM